MVASVASQFPVHPGQACTSAEGKVWAIAVKRLLPSDWLSLVDGVTPRTLFQYQKQTVPSALVYAAADLANNVPGVPQTSVLSRELDIERVTDANNIKDQTLEAHTAEMRNDFFIALEMSLADSAPLMLDNLRTSHVLTYSASMHEARWP